MDNKNKLITNILHEHIINNNFYDSVFNVFHKDFDINLFESSKYKNEVNLYHLNLTSRLTDYLNRLYSYDEIVSMSIDANSSLYHRMVTQEYKDIIFGETRIFSIDLRNKFIENNERKKTVFTKIMKLFIRKK